MPFIGLTSVTSSRFGQSSPLSWLPSPLSWEMVTHAQGRRLSWAGVAGRARKGDQGEVENIGLQIIQIKSPSGQKRGCFPTRAPLTLPGMEEGRKSPLEVSYCALPAISISGWCPLVPSHSTPGRIFFCSNSLIFFSCYFLFL